MTHEQAYRAGHQDCRDGVPVEQGLEDFMRDAVTQTGEDREDIHELANAIVVAWENSSHQFPLTYQHQLQMALIASRFLVRLSHSTPGDAEVRKLPWHSAKPVPRSTMGYGGGVMLLDAAGACIGYVVTLNKSADHDPVVIDEAVQSLLLATPSGRAQMEICPDCSGAGGDNNVWVCSRCNGSGGIATPSGQGEERAAAVKWLRMCSEGARQHHAEVCHREDDEILDAIVTRMNTYAFAADQIEAGIHLPAAPPAQDQGEGDHD